MQKYKELLKALIAYLRYCSFEKCTLTYRGMLRFLEEKGVKIEYFEGLELRLLDFNNLLFDILKEQTAMNVMKGGK